MKLKYMHEIMIRLLRMLVTANSIVLIHNN